ncbi:Putative agmatine deiminase [Polystyrenella longa]|uniref:Agmatine deiminase n=1 Tax=Polystyrenella longa TaxID=2528007 RepID=A0A518CP32_9PLAN|nr:agmatine deiminase family protein [Polystyrenella longa]QDU80986.1 Putative agmatine deiminase [Polystyrenella longa]
MTTPRELGFRMPAEWEPHASTWLSWPHNEKSWPGKIEKVFPAYAKLVAALAESEPVHINMNSPEMEKQARTHLKHAGAAGEIHFHQFPTNDAWCRDHGAIFVVNDQELAAVNWKYNAWGGKYPHDLDDEIPSQMAEHLGIRCFDAPMVLEGGSIEVNGQGLLMTTEACLLHPNRNPDLNREQIEQYLSDYLNVSEFLWLGDGIVGDDTDGHIDDLARFVSPETIVTTVETEPDDPNFEILHENLDRLKNFRTAAGKAFDIVELPMPQAVVWERERLPATYANFYISNEAVIVPGYDAKSDEIARGILQDLFPSRKIVVIDCIDIIWGLGAFHCLTQQVPARN